jgi:hypothetical protein
MLRSLQEIMAFQKVQLDYNVHIDKKKCPHLLKAWGMKDTWFFGLVILIKMTILTKC